MSRYIQKTIREVLRNNHQYSQGDEQVREDMKKLFKPNNREHKKIKGFSQHDKNN